MNGNEVCPMKKAYFSKRIYKNTIENKDVEAIGHALLLFNQAKYYAVNVQVKEERTGTIKRNKSMHLSLKDRFGMNDHFRNSALREANALLKSQKELKKDYMLHKQEQIKSVKKKIKSTKSKVTTLNKIKQSFVAGQPTFNKTSKEQKLGRFFVVQYKQNTDIYYHAYQFEHDYVDVQLKDLKSRLGRLHFRLDRLTKIQETIKNKVNNVVFGSKKLFKQQFTVDRYIENHELWRKDWDKARYNQMIISGRKDAKMGNFIFSYNAKSGILSFLTPNGTSVGLEVSFPYGQEVVNQALETQIKCENKKKSGKPMAWAIEDRGDYYIVKCIVDMDETPTKNHSKADGVLGVDLNVDHIAWANINAKGQLIKSGVLHVDIMNKTSGQITKTIEAEAIALVDLAVKLHKPLALEKLNTTKSKVSHAYGNKKANRKMSMFAYHKFIFAIKNRAEKMGIVVFEVNPAYTSQIGKFKYMKRLGISIHQAASYVIARRTMGFKEKLPPMLHSCLPEKMEGLHHWVQWKSISSSLKGIRTCAFYRSEFFTFSKFRHLGELFSPGALTDLELKGLTK